MIFTDGKLLYSFSEGNKHLFLWTTSTGTLNLGWYDTESKDLNIDEDGKYPHAVCNPSSGCTYRMSYNEAKNIHEILKEKTNDN